MTRRSPLPARPRAHDWDEQLRDVARSLPGVLAGLRKSYRELERRAASVERELAEANRERSALAERLHAADKLSALGTLAAGIAHEIRNPLNGVRGFAELLAAHLAHDGRVGQWSRHIVEGVQEADAIIDNLLSFGSPERLRLEPIDGHELLASAARLALGPAGPEARVALELRCEAPPFRGDRIKLRQAVRNLIENALEAQAEAARARVEVELVRAGDELACTVSDAGPGVPAEVRPKILDPFFTTHADGTGLGLALVAVIARLHGGSVQCAPRPSTLGGAQFVLRFPYQPAQNPAASLPNPRS